MQRISVVFFGRFRLFEYIAAVHRENRCRFQVRDDFDAVEREIHNFGILRKVMDLGVVRKRQDLLVNDYKIDKLSHFYLTTIFLPFWM